MNRIHKAAAVIFALGTLVAAGKYGEAKITGPRHDPATATPQSAGMYRLPFADGTRVKVFDDFTTHRPRGRVDIFALGDPTSPGPWTAVGSSLTTTMASAS